ncbi:adenine phosphoribosyltransferase-like [Schistocerca gregaria]|uniref:adenine phosphoribosyltransferase-like n=1 Tax=Schistocerca gregaria TaxID=7010 RepID=UPI00211E2C0F|nr:adenine phosphoribosyltransferase-like [Schistocerca gregaria]
MQDQAAPSMEYVRSLIRRYDGFPNEKVVFRDIHPIVYDPRARRWIKDFLTERYKSQRLDAVLGLESRGYYFGLLLADALELPFVPFRKAGKLPGECGMRSYSTEYGECTIEVQKDAVKSGWRVAIIDDIIAMGGTAKASCELARELGLEVVEFFVVAELKDLKGRSRLSGEVPFFSLFEL